MDGSAVINGIGDVRFNYEDGEYYVYEFYTSKNSDLRWIKLHPFIYGRVFCLKEGVTPAGNKIESTAKAGLIQALRQQKLTNASLYEFVKQ